MLCGEKNKKKRDRERMKKREKVQQQRSRVDKDCAEMAGKKKIRQVEVPREGGRGRGGES